MPRPRLLWQIYAPFLIILLVAIFAAGWYASHSLRELFNETAEEDLAARARMVEDQFRAALLSGDTRQVDSLCDRIGRNSGTRLTVVLPSGEVVGDSERDPADMDNYADRPEIRGAFEQGIGSKVRYSYTLEREMMYVAIPLVADGEVLGVLRTSLNLSTLQEALRNSYVRIMAAGAFIAALAAIVAGFLSSRISKPLEEMKHCAEQFARGELDLRVPLGGSEEVASLGEALNQMATQLDERIHTIALQRNEKTAILASMVEGVLAVDSQERLISVNQAARDMLAIAAQETADKPIQEIVRNPTLQDLVGQVLGGSGPVEQEILLRNGQEKVLHAHASDLRSANGERIGALLMLNDITRLRRLETVRQDFVANVSHELRTPITSIKGFVETLQDDPLDDADHVRHFLRIIARQVDRLNAIIEDLLLLSSIEQDLEGRQLKRSATVLGDVLTASAELCAARAAEKGTLIEVECPPDLTAEVNAPLLEQALVNLIDNAVKYSEAEARIEVTANEEEDGIAVSVRDYGVGIQAEHLPRLFERFYRVDTARSRKMGGTGLGLAIVKHIARAHNGYVTVESAPNEGSRFTIHLPAEAPPEAAEV